MHWLLLLSICTTLPDNMGWECGGDIAGLGVPVRYATLKACAATRRELKRTRPDVIAFCRRQPGDMPVG